MVSDYVVTQHDCERLRTARDPVGLAAYGMDSHMIQRYVDANGFVQNEGNVECPVAGPYPISYRAIIPRQEECDNLLVPVCVSASHIAYGSTGLGRLDYEELKEQLLKAGQRLEVSP